MARGCGFFLIGAVLGYVLPLFGYIAWTEAGGVDREGAIGMGIAFVYGPAAALVCGAITAVIGARRGGG